MHKMFFGMLLVLSACEETNSEYDHMGTQAQSEPLKGGLSSALQEGGTSGNKWTYMVFGNLEDPGVSVGSVTKLDNNMVVPYNFRSNSNFDLIALVDFYETGGFLVYFGAQEPEFISLDEADIPNQGGEVDMGDGATLDAFISYAFSRFPADRYALQVENHGGAYAGVSFDKNGGTTRQNRLEFQNYEFQSVLEKLKQYRNGQKLDVLVFNACMMSNWEVTMALEPYAELMLASETPISQWDHHEYINNLMSIPYLDGMTFASIAFNDFSNVTAAAATIIQLNNINLVGQAIDDLAYALLESPPEIINQLDLVRASSQFAGYSLPSGNNVYALLDLIDFAEQLTIRIEDEEIRTLALSVQQAVQQSVPLFDNIGGHFERTNGLSILFPEPGKVEEVFELTDYRDGIGSTWSQTTRWDELLLKFDEVNCHGRASYAGTCENGILTKCIDGAVVEEDCQANGQFCYEDKETLMASCVDDLPCIFRHGQVVSELGKCNDGVLYRCDRSNEKERLVIEDCAASNQICQFNMDEQRIQCVEPTAAPCSEFENHSCIPEADYLTCCVGTLEMSCDSKSNSVYVVKDCAKTSETAQCGRVADLITGDDHMECYVPCEDGDVKCEFDSMIYECFDGKWSLREDCLERDMFCEAGVGTCVP